MSPRPLKHAAGGFSLTELLAAMAIFSVGVMACVELYSVSLRSSTNALDYSQAVFLAQQLMEETLAEDYLVATSDSGDFGDAFPRHTWEMDIDDTDQSSLMKVHVLVRWTERNVEKQYELTSLYADREVVDVTE
jgi:type II secretion system protein I